MARRLIGTLERIVSLPGTVDDVKTWSVFLAGAVLSALRWWNTVRERLAEVVMSRAEWVASIVVMSRAEWVASIDTVLWVTGTVAMALTGLMFLAMCWNTYKKYATASGTRVVSDSGSPREPPGPQPASSPPGPRLGAAPTSYTWSGSTEVSGEVAEIIDSLERIPLTQLALERAIQPHIGKRLKVQVIIGDISLSLIWVVVRLGWVVGPSIVLRFSDLEWGERLETMDAGHAISAEGRITSITRPLGAIEIRMENCALVDG